MIASAPPWPACGAQHLQADTGVPGAPAGVAWHRPTPAYWALWLQRPELALVAESCRAERRLHQALQADPLRRIGDVELAALADADVRQNWRLWRGLRDGVTAAGSLEAFYLGLMRSGRITLPPLFIDLLVQALVARLLATENDARIGRAAELLFRPQQLSLESGRVLAADHEALRAQRGDGGFGSLGRLLAEAGAPLRGSEWAVLGDDQAAAWWQDAQRPTPRRQWLLDLTLQQAKTLAPGVSVPLTLAHSGLQSLAQVLQRWLAQLLGLQATITPLPRIADAAWRWHLGLDAESSAILNDLYAGQALPDARLARLVGLFRLDIADAGRLRPELRGAPVWLGLAMDADGLLRLKPQNLLLNLPLLD